MRTSTQTSSTVPLFYTHFIIEQFHPQRRNEDYQHWPFSCKSQERFVQKSAVWEDQLSPFVSLCPTNSVDYTNDSCLPSRIQNFDRRNLEHACRWSLNPSSLCRTLRHIVSKSGQIFKPVACVSTVRCYTHTLLMQFKCISLLMTVAAGITLRRV